MYGIVLSVAACLRAGTKVDVAWVVDTEGFDRPDPTGALAITPGGGRVGSLLAGALDDQLADLAGRGAPRGRLIDLEIGAVEALIADLPAGGHARCLLVPAATLPPELWDLLGERAPICLVSRLDGNEVVETTLLTADRVAEAGEAAAGAFGRRASDTIVGDATIITVLWPVPQLVIVGGGVVSDALERAAALLGWQTQVVEDAGTATGLIAGLAALDKVVVTGHDPELTGRALAAALSSDVGYIGALGSHRVQQTRADWLAYRGFTELERIHGPAGLDIGADTPAKVAIAILAEVLTVESGSMSGLRRDDAGSGPR